MNKFKSILSAHDKNKLLSIIKCKARSSNITNIRSSWKFMIPLQTKHKLCVFHRCISTLIHKLKCPSIIKTYIKNNVHLYFRATRRIISLIRMHREHCDRIKYSDVKDPIQCDMKCHCHNFPHTNLNKLGHTFLRTDDPSHISKLLDDIPSLNRYRDILCSSPQDDSKDAIYTKSTLSNFLKSLPVSKGQGKSFC